MLEIEQAELRERFQALLAQEQEALQAYQQLLSLTSEPGAREQVQQLLRDKQRHVLLAESLLEIVD